MRSVLAFLILGAGYLPASPAQDASCLRRTFSVTAVDAARKPIQGLTPADFEAKFRGLPVHILSVAPDNRPRRIVVLLDASASMRGSENEWQLARAMAAHVAHSRPAKTELALIIFADKIVEQIDFSQGTNAVAERLTRIGAQQDYAKKNVRGRTALWDAILAGFRLLRVPTSADVLYVISDGGENVSHSTANQGERALLSTGVRLFVSLFPADPVDRHVGHAQDLMNIAEVSGGGVFGPVGAVGLELPNFRLRDDQKRAYDAALERFYLAMLLNYRVEVEFPQPAKKWADWSLRLSSEKRRQFKDAQVGFPARLAPCAIPASND